MHRTDGDGHSSNHFTDGNPGTGVPGTKVEENWLNAVQEEICNLLEGMGVTLVKGTNDQLLDACVSAATPQMIVRRDASGRAKCAAPAADGDIVVRPVAKADHAPLGQAISASCGNFSTTGHMVDVTNLSVTLTTTGRPVEIFLQPDGTDHNTCAAIGGNTFTPTQLGLAILRDGVEIANYQFQALVGPSAVRFLDVGAGAGEHTYKIQAQVYTGTGSVYVQYSKLVVVEL